MALLEIVSHFTKDIACNIGDNADTYESGKNLSQKLATQPNYLLKHFVYIYPVFLVILLGSCKSVKEIFSHKTLWNNPHDPRGKY